MKAKSKLLTVLFILAVLICALALSHTPTSFAQLPDSRSLNIKAEDSKDIKLYDYSYIVAHYLLAAPRASQRAARPIRRDGLVKALQLNALTAKELADLIRKRGVDFKVTPEVEAELREAGATPAVIEAVRESYREAASARVDPAQQELAFWNSVQSSDDPEDFRDYLEKYPAGLYAGIARRRLAALTNGKSVPAPPTTEGAAPNMMTGAVGPKPGSVTRTHSGIELVYVPPGKFMMGSENGSADEKPVHRVTISKGFYMGKYEVTQAQWRAVMGNNPSNFNGDNLPMELVSWDDAISFIAKMNAQNDGFDYRLPTEAEWEYACRAGTTGDYAGDLDAMAWYGYEKAGKQTHPVGTKQPNAFGLYDMHGNVWEWCQDWYHDDYVGGPVDESAWVSGGEQKYRVLRGGSWGNLAHILRSANRLRYVPDLRNADIGFRVVAVART